MCYLPEKNLNSDGLNPSIGLSKKKMKHANPGPKDSPLLPDWNDSLGSASRIKDTEEDDSMVRSGGFVGDNETDDLERKSLSLAGFKDNKKALVGHFKKK